VFLTMHGVEEDILGQRWRGSQLAWALAECAGVVSVAQSLCDVAVAHGVPREKIRVIPYAVDRRTFHPGPRDEARRQLGIPVEGRLVVSVGMFEHRKGHHLLLEALTRLPGVRLALVGDRTHEPRYVGAIQQMVEDLGLRDRVLLPGPQPRERVADWLRAADVFALATYYEAHCNAILEALACGLPVVTTPVGDNALLVDPPRRGVLVPVGDATALAAAVEKALETAWDRQEIAGYGAGRSWDTVARETLAFFRERLTAR
jgi:glycosyltransferase involved in cell wall biosynthesis